MYASVSGCSGYLTNLLRIKASLVYIERSETRIGTGVCDSKSLDEIFTLKTHVVDMATKRFLGTEEVEKFFKNDMRVDESSIKIINGLGQESDVLLRCDLDSRTIGLTVSINQYNLFIFKSSKQVFCVNN